MIFPCSVCDAAIPVLWCGVSLIEAMTEIDAFRLITDIDAKYGVVDPITAHKKADEVLVIFLSSMGYREVVKAWRRIDKYYG